MGSYEQMYTVENAYLSTITTSATDTFPFAVVSLDNLSGYGEAKRLKKIWHEQRCTDYFVTEECGGSPQRESYLIKIIPRQGWLVLGDAIIQAPPGNNPNNYSGITNSIKIVFVKNDPLYAIPCDSQYQLIDLSTQTEGPDGGANCDLFHDAEYYSDNWTSTVMKLNTTNTNYMAPGTRFKYGWAEYEEDDLKNYAAINKAWIEIASYKLARKSTDYWWNGGSKVADGGSEAGGCDFAAYSSVGYYDRTNSKNGNIIDETQDSEITEGTLKYIGNSFSITPPNWDWQDDNSSEGPSQIIYIIHFMGTNRLCCLGIGNFGAAECGLGLNKIQPGSAICVDQLRKDCTWRHDLFTKNYCLKNACRNSTDSTNPLVCDYELKKFCNDTPIPTFTKQEVQEFINERERQLDESIRIKDTIRWFNFNTQMDNNTQIKYIRSTMGEEMAKREKDIVWDICSNGLDVDVGNDYKDICNNVKRSFNTAKNLIKNAKKLLDFYNSTGPTIPDNYLKYPDMCGCFMSTKNLKPECESMADALGIRNNKPAKYSLNIDTDDPLQCNQNCAVHPICRQMTVPSAQGYPSLREGKYVQRGSIQDKSACPEKNLCVQTATVNVQGKIGGLSIKQDANCGSYKSKFCQNSVLSKCIYQISEGEFVKQVIEDKDGGACTSSLESLSCASLNLTPIMDKGCINGKRTIVFEQKKKEVNPEDAIDAVKSILSDGLLNPKLEYDKEGNTVSVISDCQDCEMDYELTSSCFLEGNQWKIKGKKTKIKKQPLNGGKECVIDNSEKTIDCPDNADCAVTVKSQDSGCKNEKRSIEFNISSLPSGDGKSCDDVVLPLLPQLYKNNPVSVLYSADKKTLTTSIPCKDCVVDYKIDPSYNDCYFEGGKNVIRKIPYLKKQPLNGGTCSTELLNAIKNKTPKIEECTFDQDCKFSSEPSSVGNCIGGEKTYEFEVEVPSNNNGKKCEEVAKTFGKKYTKDTSKNVYMNNKLYIKGGCGNEQDCMIDDEPYQTACVEGNGVEIYRVLTPQGNGGRTCEEVIKDKYKGETIEVKEEGRKITVNKSCAVETGSYQTYIQLSVLIAVAIIVVVLVLFLVQ